jgi:hypothetical protein
VTDRLYRKEGQTIRAEFSRGTLSILNVSERGLAIERNGFFESRQEPAEISVDAPGDPTVAGMANDLKGDPAVERFTILSGSAIHSIEGGNQWNERFGRMHISMVNREHRVRVMLELGGESLDHFDMALIDLVRTALQQSFVEEPPPFHAVRLLPHVAAALTTAGDSIAEQSTHPAFRFDGDGKEILPARSAPWPNRFRPSYRSRPIPMPFHLRMRPRGVDSSVEVTAIAISDPFRRVGDTVTGSVLCTNSRNVFVAPLILDAQSEDRIRYVSDKMTWFPYRAGVWGSDTIVAIYE